MPDNVAVDLFPEREAHRISLVRAAREQLERQIQQDMAELDDHAGHAAWQQAHHHAKESPREPS